MFKTVYPSSYYRKPSLEEQIDRNSVKYKSVFAIIIFVVMFAFMLGGLLNLFPMIAWGYGFIWHVFNFLALPAALIVSFSDATPIINIVLIITIVNFIVNVFAFALVLYTLIVCYTQSIPANCINFQFMNILITLLSAVLVILSGVILLSLISLTKRVNKSVRTVKKKRKNKTRGRQ